MCIARAVIPNFFVYPAALAYNWTQQEQSFLFAANRILLLQLNSVAVSALYVFHLLRVLAPVFQSAV